MFLVDEGRASDNFEVIAAHISGLFERHGAAIDKLEKWDSRRLAYEINGQKRGTYILVKFSADPANIDALRKDCELSNTVMRALLLREDNVGMPLIEQAGGRRHPAAAQAAKPEPEPKAADAQPEEAEAEREPPAEPEPEPAFDILGDMEALEEPPADADADDEETT
ncbi:MAG: 30S ribosomal protein S6 [Planctomycetota bacterium]